MESYSHDISPKKWNLQEPWRPSCKTNIESTGRALWGLWYMLCSCLERDSSYAFCFGLKKKRRRTKLHKRLKATQSKHWPLMKTIFLRIKPQILNPMGKKKKKIRKRQIVIELTYITSSDYFQWKNVQLASLSKNSS